jgi:hypothetical protein
MITLSKTNDNNEKISHSTSQKPFWILNFVNQVKFDRNKIYNIISDHIIQLIPLYYGYMFVFKKQKRDQNNYLGNSVEVWFNLELHL